MAISLLLSLVVLGAPQDAGGAAKSLTWAAKVLKAAPSLDGSAVATTPEWGYEKAALAYAGIIKKYGESKEAFVGLGSACRGLGNYSAAAAAFERAVEMDRTDLSVVKLHSEALQLDQIKEKVGPLLPKGLVVLHVAPISKSKKQAYAILSGQVLPQDAFRLYSRLRLAIYAADIVKPGFIYDQPIEVDLYDGGCNQAHLIVREMDGDQGSPEAIVFMAAYAAQMMPTRVQVFDLNGSQTKMIGDVASTSSPTIKDLNNDGRPELMSTFEIGRHIPRSGQPSWLEIYSIRSGQYVEANVRFPKQFLSRATELRQTLAQYPGDWDIWKYLGLTYEIMKNRAGAKTAYANALRYCLSEYGMKLKETPDPSVADWHASQLQDLRREIAELRQKTRSP